MYLCITNSYGCHLLTIVVPVPTLLDWIVIFYFIYLSIDYYYYWSAYHRIIVPVTGILNIQNYFSEHSCGLLSSFWDFMKLNHVLFSLPSNTKAIDSNVADSKSIIDFVHQEGRIRVQLIEQLFLLRVCVCMCVCVLCTHNRPRQTDRME